MACPCRACVSEALKENSERKVSEEQVRTASEGFEDDDYEEEYAAADDYDEDDFEDDEE